MKELDSEYNRLSSIGIEVRTRDLSNPAQGYPGFVLMERMIGVVYGVAQTYCPHRVYLAPALRLVDAMPADLTLLDSAHLDRDAAGNGKYLGVLSCAATAVAALVHEREQARES